jgi:hypothetical protein
MGVRNTKLTEDEPHDDLTRLGNLVLEALEGRGDTEDVRAVVMLFRKVDETTDQVGTAIRGYEDNGAEAAADMLVALQGIFAANGLTLNVIQAPVVGEG